MLNTICCTGLAQDRNISVRTLAQAFRALKYKHQHGVKLF